MGSNSERVEVDVMDGASLWDLASCCSGFTDRSDVVPDMNITNTNHTIANSSSSFSQQHVLLSPYYQHSPAMSALFILAYLFIFLLCMLGNGVVCAIVLRNRRMWTVTNIFILNLSVSDLLVGIFCIPTTLVDNLITGWPFGNIICKLSGLVQGVSVCASVFTLVAIAVDRFRCIVYPFKPKLTLLVAKLTIGMIWLSALGIMLPSAVMLTVQRERGHFTVDGDLNDSNLTYPLYSCYETWPEPRMRKVYTTVLFAHIYLVPLILIVLMYGRIGAKLYSTTVLVNLEDPNCASVVGPGKSLVSQRKIKVIKMLIVVALLFMLSWLPLWTLMLLTDYTSPDEEQLELLTGYIFPLSHWLAFSNSSVNPIIYGFFNENFRRGFRAAWRLRPCVCWESVSELSFSKSKRGSKVPSHLDKALGANSLGLGARNRVYTDTDLTGCVRLEMEHKRPSAETENSSGREGNGPTFPKRELFEDVERISPTGAFCQAWEL